MKRLPKTTTITITILIIGVLTLPFIPKVIGILVPGSTTLLTIVSGFLYLILIPGYFLNSLLRVSEETAHPHMELAHIIGLGTGFSELAGLSAYYISKTLTLNFRPAYLAVNTLFLTTLVVFYAKHHEKSKKTEGPSKRRRNLVKNGIVSFIIISLGITGSYLVATRNMYYPLLLDYIMIIAVLLTKDKMRFFSGLSSPFLLWTVALTLLYTTSLSISWQNLQGWDIFGEFYVAKNVYLHQSIQITFKDYVLNTYLSSLSVSLLPFVFKAVGNVPIITLFKLVYPFIFSLTAPILYTLYHEVSGSKKMALFATILNIVFYQYFLFNLQLARLMIGAFYYVLFLYMLTRVNERRGQILAFLWALLTVVNYYTIGYLLLMQLIFLSVWNYILPKLRREQTLPENPPGYFQKTVLALTGVFVLWYGYFSGGATLRRILRKIRKFITSFLPTSSSSTSSNTPQVTQSPTTPETARIQHPKHVPITSAPPWIHTIRNIILASALGFSTVGLLMNIKGHPQKNSHKLSHSSLTGMGLFWSGLSAMVYIFPTIALTLNAPRVYSLSMFVLSIYSIWGLYFISKVIISRISRNPERTRIIVDAIVILYLLTYFVSSTGLFAVVTNDHSFPPPVQFNTAIDWPRGSEEEMTVGLWMESHQNTNCTIYSDEFRIKFMPYTGNRKMIGNPPQPLKLTNSSCGYLFLGQYNIKHRELLIYIPKLKVRYYWPLPESIPLTTNIIYSTESTEMLYWRET